MSASDSAIMDSVTKLAELTPDQYCALFKKLFDQSMDENLGKLERKMDKCTFVDVVILVLVP